METLCLIGHRCGETLSDPDRDDAVLRTARDLYRQKHGLLTSSNIARLRGRYGLSQRALARLLGWGEVTIQRYEKGVILSPLRLVLEKFGQAPASRLSDLSHREEAWLSRGNGQLIPYDEAEGVLLLS